MISNSQHPTHLLPLPLLLKQSRLLTLQNPKPQTPINILPLFQTIQPLQNPSPLIQTIFTNQSYPHLLQTPHNIHQIILPYSHSNKHPPYLTTSS
ncbi:phosphoenolpyruvate carboxylase, partial [Neisseria sicca]|uniref:phosphoenolpyruvate carboxylase n=1 Tax=Neisseria sicca TaxID=490 RepID=UPI0034D97722